MFKNGHYFHVQVKKSVCLETVLIILDGKKGNCYLNTSYVKPVVKNGPF